MRFQTVDRTEPAMLRDCSVTEVLTGLPGRRIIEVGRLGKFIIVKLEGTPSSHCTSA